MLNEIDIPNLPGYVSIKEAAEIMGISDKRVYQHVRAGRLAARRVGHILILPLELATEIRVSVRKGQQSKLVEKLKTIQKLDKHTFPGTVARYVMQGDETLETLQIFLIWKSTEMPGEEARKRDFASFQEELADVVDWETAQSATNEIIIHT